MLLLAPTAPLSDVKRGLIFPCQGHPYMSNARIGCGFGYWLTIFAIVAVVGSCTAANSDTIPLVCTWTLYGHETDSFVIDLKAEEVYWVEEDARLPLAEVNEGRFAFAGVLSELQVGTYELLTNVALRFIINRVSGEVFVSPADSAWSLPEGYMNTCTVVEVF